MVKNQEVAKKILDMIDTLIEASEELFDLFTEFRYLEFESLAKDMLEAMYTIHNNVLSMKLEEPSLNIDLACESVSYSVKHIIRLSYIRSSNVLKKIEFELIPLLQEMKLNFYYWACIFPNENLMKHYYKNEVIPLSANKYINQAECIGKYKYDLSIIVLAYNKLEYTKLCIEYILKYVPKNINYELILINHGSTDGTKEYFESIAPNKQLDILKNGGGLYAVTRIVEGKYVLSISNDVLVTENAIHNMMECMDSDEKIARIVPSTPNVSNLQSIDAKYSNIEEMHEFSNKNNIMDKFRWEQRARLCDPIAMLRSKVVYSSKGIPFGRYYTCPNIQSFPDDNVSLLLRRNGFKMILAKDAYCYHFGSVTLKDEIESNKDKYGKIGQKAFYNEGRKEFYNVFGIDPWGIGMCWDPQLFQCLECNETEHVDILGINCGIGSNPLKVKESIKENVRNLDVTIYNITDDQSYIQDLKGVSDYAKYIEDCSDIKNIFHNKKFKYIIFESKFETYKDSLTLISDLKDFIEKNGVIAISSINIDLQKQIKKRYSNVIESGEWIILK